jgi:hypothetical protein
LRAAAEKLAKHMAWHFGRVIGGFHNCHGTTNRKMSGESLSADTDQVELFRQYIKDLIKCESLTLSQIYNVDETGVFVRDVPENTLVQRHESNTPGYFHVATSILIHSNLHLSSKLCQCYQFVGFIRNKQKTNNNVKDLYM